MTTLDMDRIVEILRTTYKVENAYVEQTGGGCATIYAGPVEKDEAGDDRYAAVAGPGWFEGPGFTVARGTTGDFYIGRDDDGETDPPMPPDGASEETVAGLIAAQVHASRLNTPTYLDDMAAWVIESSAVGYSDEGGLQELLASRPDDLPLLCAGMLGLLTLKAGEVGECAHTSMVWLYG